MEFTDQSIESKIGPYHILAKMGTGGMSTVYLTRVDGLAGFNKLAVLKILRSDLARRTEVVEMFLNEARLAARLTHPNIVHTYGAGEEKRQLYIAMEYLDGYPWSRVRRRLWSHRSLPLVMHLKVLADALAGLHYAHELRDYDDASLHVVHCDVSPQNLFVTHDGQVKVVDFGIARAVNYSQMPSQTLFLGKPAYCSPEQARGEKVDRRADIFSVGVMLWEALAGRRLVKSQDTMETLRRRGAGDEPRIRDVRPNVPLTLAQICDRALQHNPQNRFDTAEQFRQRLLEYLKANSQGLDSHLIAELINEAFQQDRRRVHSLIEQRLNHPSSLPEPVEDLNQSDQNDSSQNTLRADLSELVSVTRLESEKAVAEASILASVRPLKKRFPIWPIAIAAAVVLIVGVWIRYASSTSIVVTPQSVSQDNPSIALTKSPASTKPPSPQRVPAVASPVTTSQTVQVTVAAKPKNARLYLDGQPLPDNPYVRRFPKDNRKHRIRAHAPGYIIEEHTITLDSDRSVIIELERFRWATNRTKRRERPAAVSLKKENRLPVTTPLPRNSEQKPVPLALQETSTIVANNQPTHPIVLENDSIESKRRQTNRSISDTEFDQRLDSKPSVTRTIDEEDPF